MRTPRRAWLLPGAWLLAALALPSPAAAQDRWSRPARALRHLRRTVRLARGATTDVFALYVDLCDPAVGFRATTPEERARPVDAWAVSVGAAAAINGDYFDLPTRLPLGPARGAGRWWTPGRREHSDAVLAMGPGGAFAVLETRFDAGPDHWPAPAARIPSTYTEVVAVRERLVVDGRVRESPYIYHGPGRHPRTAVGLTADRRTLILAVIDGRSARSAGVTTRELAGVMVGLGARDVMKLDGGGSSALWLAGRGVVNRPSDGAPRAVANHLAVLVREDVPAGAPSRCPARIAAAGTTAAGTPGPAAQRDGERAPPRHRRPRDGARSRRQPAAPPPVTPYRRPRGPRRRTP